MADTTGASVDVEVREKEIKQHRRLFIIGQESDELDDIDLDQVLFSKDSDRTQRVMLNMQAEDGETVTDHMFLVFHGLHYQDLVIIDHVLRDLIAKHDSEQLIERELE